MSVGTFDSLLVVPIDIIYIYTNYIRYPSFMIPRQQQSSDGLENTAPSNSKFKLES